MSDDDGSTWAHGGRLLDGPGRPTCATPADAVGRIHVITTEQHPDDYANGIYYGVVVDDQLLRSDGTVVDADLCDDHAAASASSSPQLFTGERVARAWTVDLHVDGTGLPYAAFSVAVAAAGHRYYYARFDGVRLARPLRGPRRQCAVRRRTHYTGLVALAP